MTERCGAQMRGRTPKFCGRPIGHPGRCLSEAAWAHKTDLLKAQRVANAKPKVPYVRDYAKEYEGALRRKYGLTMDDYRSLLVAQGDVCWICSKKPKQNKRLSVDHDHRTGLIRGLLCNPCNQMLGHFHDNQRLFERAGQYLKEVPATQLGKRYVPDAPPRQGE